MRLLAILVLQALCTVTACMCESHVQTFDIIVKQLSCNLPFWDF